MSASLLIVFRQLIETALVLGIVLAATRGVAGRTLWIAIGLAAGAAGAALLPRFVSAMSGAFGGSGAAMFNASLLLATTAVFALYTAWMARRGRLLSTQAAVVDDDAGPPTLLALAVALVVLRNGAEAALLLQAFQMTQGLNTDIYTGVALGIAAAFTLAAIVYLLLCAVVSPAFMFAVTSWLIAMMAAGMATEAVQYLHASGLITAFDKPVWDLSSTLPESGLAGHLLHALIGYSERPSELQVTIYCVALFGIFFIARMARHTTQKQTAADIAAAEKQGY